MPPLSMLILFRCQRALDAMLRRHAIFADAAFAARRAAMRCYDYA